jgi:endonuclease G
MVQLRRNHSSHNKGLQTTFRLVVFFIFAIIALVAGFAYYKKHLINVPDFASEAQEDYTLRTFLPSSTGEIVHHKYYSLSYAEQHEQAEWVAYTMDREMLNIPNVDRFGMFNPDEDVKTKSSVHRDYNNSGYTRGHLVPAGDMAFDTLAMRETFLMSNVSPQVKAFNNGIWKELEENTRDWTYTNGKLYIITGPILKNVTQTIGKENKITVPSGFFKVLLDFESAEKKGIAFIIPNELSDKRLEEYMVTIDEVEKLTGLDFFDSMIENTEEEKLESNINKKSWKVSDKRYQLRINRWNYE